MMSRASPWTKASSTARPNAPNRWRVLTQKGDPGVIRPGRGHDKVALQTGEPSRVRLGPPPQRYGGGAVRATPWLPDHHVYGAPDDRIAWPDRHDDALLAPRPVGQRSQRVRGSGPKDRRDLLGGSVDRQRLLEEHGASFGATGLTS